ncbi:MAG: hypothetical protein U1A78_34425 [Polyangia bacterium]
MNSHSTLTRRLFQILAVSGLLAASGCGSPAGADLDGTWESPCYMGAKTQLAYSNLALNGTYIEYSDMTCTTQRHITTWTGTATVGAEVQAGIHKLDLSFTSFRSKPLTAAEATFVNQNQYCGFTDWASGVEKDVLGKSCYGFSIPVGGKSLDIYQVSGGMLLLGKGSKIAVQLTEAERPTELDPNRPFTKK